jgi:hypothetical protein
VAVALLVVEVVLVITVLVAVALVAAVAVDLNTPFLDSRKLVLEVMALSIRAVAAVVAGEVLALVLAVQV